MSFPDFPDALVHVPIEDVCVPAVARVLGPEDAMALLANVSGDVSAAVRGLLIAIRLAAAYRGARGSVQGALLSPTHAKLRLPSDLFRARALAPALATISAAAAAASPPCVFDVDADSVKGRLERRLARWGTDGTGFLRLPTVAVGAELCGWAEGASSIGGSGWLEGAALPQQLASAPAALATLEAVSDASGGSGGGRGEGGRGGGGVEGAAHAAAAHLGTPRMHERPERSVAGGAATAAADGIGVVRGAYAACSYSATRWTTSWSRDEQVAFHTAFSVLAREELPPGTPPLSSAAQRIYADGLYLLPVRLGDIASMVTLDRGYPSKSPVRGPSPAHIPA